MSAIDIWESLTVLCAGNAVLVCDSRNSETKVLNISGEENENGHVKTDNDRNSETKVLNVSGEENENGHGKPGNTDSISESQAICAKFSPDGKWLVVASARKVVVVWQTEEWRKITTHTLPKKPTAIAITSDGLKVLIADKTGDVYIFPLGETVPSLPPSEAPSPKPILGHFSVLLDLVVTQDMRYVITCDRDEKIRVSHHPNAYNIHTFCLGHREFVARIALLPARPQMLLSCSGDGYLKLWNYEKGECVGEIDTSPQTSPLLPKQNREEEKGGEGEEESLKTTPQEMPAVKSMAVMAVSPSTHLIATLHGRISAILLYKVEDTAFTHVSTAALTSEPIAAAWCHNEKHLVVMQRGTASEGPVVVLHVVDEQLCRLEKQHRLEEIGVQYSDLFRDLSTVVELPLLYKQRFDNVAEYLKKKNERLEAERLYEDGIGLPPKKGRWEK